MISIQKAVEAILLTSDVPYFAMQNGILNLSAYAEEIKKEVQNICKKRLQTTNAIIMALSRIQRSIKKPIKLPTLLIEGVTIKKDLAEIVIPKTLETVEATKELLTEDSTGLRIILVTYGIKEISLVVQSSDCKSLSKLFSKYKPVSQIENLASISLNTSNEHTFVPNIFYNILRRLAVKQINIIEIATTYSEITLVVEQRNLNIAYSLLSGIFKDKEDLFL